MGRIVEVQQEPDLPGDLRARLDHDEPREHALALQYATAGSDQCLVEEQIPVRRQPPEDLVDHGLASVKIDWSAGDGEGVHALRVQRGVDRREPSALTIADQVHAAATVLDGEVDHVEVVVDRGAGRLARGADPVQRESALEP